MNSIFKLFEGYDGPTMITLICVFVVIFLLFIIAIYYIILSIIKFINDCKIIKQLNNGKKKRKITKEEYNIRKNLVNTMRSSFSKK